MFNQFRISLTRPKDIYLFLEDAWWQVLLYIFIVPLFLLIPLLLSVISGSTMTDARFQRLQSQIYTSFNAQNAVITEGTLTYQNSYAIQLDAYFVATIGHPRELNFLNLSFEEHELVLYVANSKVAYAPYEDLDLLNFDFSSLSTSEANRLATAIRLFLVEYAPLTALDFSLSYFFYLRDFLVIIILMTVFSMIFSSHLELPFGTRFKATTYLATVYMILSLILILLGVPQLQLVALIIFGVYHQLAFRSILINYKGV